MLEIIGFIILTLTIVSFSAILGRKYGKEYIIGCFVGLIVIANVLANKIVDFLYWAIPAGVIVYSSSFLLTDILAEFYNKRDAKRAVWIGFFVNLILVVSILIAIYLPSASLWTGQESFVLILGNTWRIVVASLVAYILSQSHDVWSFCFWKKKTRGKALWFRNNASTIVSQIIDTIVFSFIAFYGLFPIIRIIIGHLIIKIVIAILDTPFIYGVRYFYKFRK